MYEKEIATTIGFLVGVSYIINKKLAIFHDLFTYGKLVPTLLKHKLRIKQNQTIPDIFEKMVDKIPNNVATIHLNQSLTFKDMDEKANQIANWALDVLGLRRGDRVALLMQNCSEYIWIWIGLSKIGVAVALINTHISKKTLLHCLSICDTGILLFGEECSKQVDEIQCELTSYRYYLHSSKENGHQLSLPPYAESLNNALESMPSTRPHKSIRDGIQSRDVALMIYTSGTTGLPKAANVSHKTIMYYGTVFTTSGNITPEDRIYCSLPLYHTVGGTLSVGMMIFGGATLVIAKSFSASKFWSEVRSHDCTVIQYIGELCRYLLAVQPDPELDQKNKVRMAIGNGLRPDIWSTFQSRFDIPCIFEFYGSTEGIAGLINVCTTSDQQRNLGKTGFLAEKVLGLSLIKYNVETDEHVKDENGYYVRCKPNEVGELVAIDKNKHFAGYHGSKKATEEKILRNVFKEGDSYLRTGDLFKQDDRRKWYFVDRIGDTFRWKGENVSTTEVAEVISLFPNVKEVNIYGVQIPGFDGRACMAAMCWESASFSFDDFLKYVQSELPSYAMPIFVRKVEQMQVTGTLKHQKHQLRSEGMDPNKSSDPLWFLKDGKFYLPLTKEVYPEVLKSRI